MLEQTSASGVVFESRAATGVVKTQTCGSRGAKLDGTDKKETEADGGRVWFLISGDIRWRDWCGIVGSFRNLSMRCCRIVRKNLAKFGCI